MINPQKIAITGGSGHLGTCLIDLLLSQNYLVNALYTNTLPTKKHDNLTWIKGDICDFNVINKLIQDCSTIIHCAGMISIGAKNTDEVYRVNVTGTENIVKACIKSPSIKLIQISSSNAVKETKDNEVFNENRPYKTVDDFIYSYTKATAEQFVLKAVKESNLNACIIRPTSIVGPPDDKPSLFGQTILDLSQNKMPAITSGGYNLVDVRDISQTLINCIDKGKKGEVYLVAGEYLTLKKIAKISNPQKTPIEIPLNLLLFFMPLINVYQKIFDLKWPITKESLVTVKFAPKNMDISKAKKELNHNPRPVKNSIEDLIDWFQTKNK
jgi:dihydroflavonol-4-reductase